MKNYINLICLIQGVDAEAYYNLFILKKELLLERSENWQ